MKNKISMFILLAIAIISVACTPKNLWKSEPSMTKVSNTFFDASISPIYRFNGYKGFLLNVHNKTSGKIEIDWNNTFYVHSGNKDGGFWVEGIPYDASKESGNTYIASGDIFNNEIYPAKLRVLSQMAAAYVNEDMKTGENGIYLTINVQAKPISETLTLVFSQE